jgi:acetyl esterase/lipase
MAPVLALRGGLPAPQRAAGPDSAAGLVHRVRQPRPEGPQPVEAIRVGFKALMAQMIVPDGIRTAQTKLGDRPALQVEPDNAPGAGTILYFHGGGHAFGSPETAMSLTGNLVIKDVAAEQVHAGG